MRLLVFVIAIVFTIAGLWPLGLLLAVVAIGMSPGGKRVDGKARTGGLLGGVWDAVAAPSQSCPACRTDIPKKATRCPQCTEVLT